MSNDSMTACGSTTWLAAGMPASACQFSLIRGRAAGRLKRG
ncbi:hypothetical protein [Aquicella siphonis]|nr:hypothetical protein [Aquicella siphonis]